MLSGRFNTEYLTVSEHWSYNDLQAALDILDRLEAAESRAGET